MSASDPRIPRPAGSTSHGLQWSPPAPERLAGLLPQFRIVRLIGQGGMGAVYEAVQLVLERTVAIKVLPAECAADAEFVARFHREARTLARLPHPGIVAIYDFGQTSEGHLYFVMEYVDGSDLAKLIRGGGVTIAQALALTAQVCEALQHAHAQGVIHRDIKPANILVSPDGRAKLADFGLARPAHEASGTMPMSKLARGTPDYMAPEQREGVADHRSDIYALGVLLYEMLTGRRPKGVFDPPSAKVSVDVRVDEVVVKALQQEPERRYQQVDDMKTDVEHIRSTPVAAPTLASSAVPRPQRSWGRFVAGALAGALGAAIAIGAALAWLWPQQPAATTRKALPPTELATPEPAIREISSSTPDPALLASPDADAMKLKDGLLVRVVNRDGRSIAATAIPEDFRSRLAKVDLRGASSSGLVLAKAILPKDEQNAYYGASLVGKSWFGGMHYLNVGNGANPDVICIQLTKSGGPCRLEVKKMGYKPITIPIPEIDPSGKVIWLGELKLERYDRYEPVWHTVGGSVVTDKGVPLNSGEATIRVNGTPHQTKCAISNGAFRFPDITSGDYLVEFWIDGYSVDGYSVSVKDADEFKKVTAFPLRNFVFQIRDSDDTRRVALTAGIPYRDKEITFADRTKLRVIQDGEVIHLDCPRDVRMRIGGRTFDSGSYRWTGELKKGDTIELLAQAQEKVLHMVECVEADAPAASNAPTAAKPAPSTPAATPKPAPTSVPSPAPAAKASPRPSAQTPAQGAKAFTLSTKGIMALDDTKAERFYRPAFTASITARRERPGGGVELDIHFPSTKTPDYTLQLTSNQWAGAKTLMGLDVSEFKSYDLKFTLLRADGSTAASPNLTAGALIGPTPEGRNFGFRPVSIGLPSQPTAVSNTSSFAANPSVIGLTISLYGGKWADGPHDVTVLVEPVAGATPLP